MKRSLVALSIIAVLALVGVAGAVADSVGPITFEPPTYAAGNINGQNGWTKTGPYDVAVAAVSSFPAASGYSFGTQALRLSNAVTSGSFGDQTFAPSLANAAGESTSFNHFDATFSIGTALATLQPGLTLSVSPDDGTGGRMSYLRFEDQTDGVHVFFDDVTDPGPLGTVATFNQHDIATLDRAHAHTLRFSIDFVPGAGNDVVKIYVDGALKATGTTWENYYRYDPEQAGNHNAVPATKTLLFRESGTPVATSSGNGFLVDNVSFASSATTTTGGKNACKHHGWKTFTNPSFKNQGQCIKSMKHHDEHNSGKDKDDDSGQSGNSSSASIANAGKQSHGDDDR
jgi:hypothetical protein